MSPTINAFNSAYAARPNFAAQARPSYTQLGAQNYQSSQPQQDIGPSSAKAAARSPLLLEGGLLAGAGLAAAKVLGLAGAGALGLFAVVKTAALAAGAACAGCCGLGALAAFMWR